MCGSTEVRNQSPISCLPVVAPGGSLCAVLTASNLCRITQGMSRVLSEYCLAAQYSRGLLEALSLLSLSFIISKVEILDVSLTF